MLRSTRQDRTSEIEFIVTQEALVGCVSCSGICETDSGGYGSIQAGCHASTEKTRTRFRWMHSPPSDPSARMRGQRPGCLVIAIPCPYSLCLPRTRSHTSRLHTAHSCLFAGRGRFRVGRQLNVEQVDEQRPSDLFIPNCLLTKVSFPSSICESPGEAIAYKSSFYFDSSP